MCATNLLGLFEVCDEKIIGSRAGGGEPELGVGQAGVQSPRHLLPPPPRVQAGQER